MIKATRLVSSPEAPLDDTTDPTPAATMSRTTTKVTTKSISQAPALCPYVAKLRPSGSNSRSAMGVHRSDAACCRRAGVGAEAAPSTGGGGAPGEWGRGDPAEWF